MKCLINRNIFTLIILLTFGLRFPLASQDLIISEEGVFNSCSGSIYDSGGADNEYAANENYVITVCSDDPILCPQIEAQYFVQDDIINIYDGPDTSFPLVVTLIGSDLLAPLAMINGCFTVEFISNGVVQDTGFEIIFNCVNSCTSCDDGIQNGDETGVDCGGSCAPCVTALPQDCVGALPICDDVIQQPLSSNSAGDFPNEVSTSTCLVLGEANSLWYIFTMGTDGELSFTLDPEDDGNDYDWVLFNITNSSCENLATDPSLLVSCNSWGDFTFNGPTGMSSSSGGTGNSNGPGTINGPAFNADEPVTAGETFVLMVSDWSGTPAGYSLDFSESTAELFDTEDPFITNIEVQCENISLTFSENIDCASLDFDDFQLVQNTDVYNVSAIESNCNSGVLFANQISLSFTPEIPANGDDFTFSVVGGFGSVTDLCGNPAPLSDTTLIISIGIEAELEIIASTCNEADGSIEVLNTNGGIAPYTYILDGSSQTNPLFENLAAGDYTLIVEDDEGCSSTQSVTIDGQNGINYVIGNNEILCSLDLQLEAESSPGFTGTWTASGDITFGDPSDPNTTATASFGGPQQLTWTIDDGVECILSDSIEVFFTEIEVDLDVDNALCSGVCDGEASASSIQGGESPYQCSWSGGIEDPTNCAVTNLCPGDFSLAVTDAHNCQVSIDFSIMQTSFFTIDSVNSIDEFCKNYCDGALEIFAENGVQFSIDGGDTFSPNSNFNNLCNGEYEIIARDINNCDYTDFAYISFPIPPNANFTVNNPIMIWSNPVFEINNNSSNFINSYWEFGYPNSLLSSSDENPTLISPSIEIGDYQIQLIVEDELGCTDSTYRTVTIRDDVLIYVPNSFTPNEDGVNDVFIPILNDVDIENYEFSIYDRYGNQIFRTSDPMHGWDGSGKVNKVYYAPNGIYNWYLNFKAGTTSERIVHTGSILLIR